MSILPQAEKPALVWSNAMFEPAKAGKDTMCKIGFVIFCPRRGKYLYSAFDVSSRIFELFKPTKNCIGRRRC